MLIFVHHAAGLGRTCRDCCARSRREAPASGKRGNIHMRKNAPVLLLAVALLLIAACSSNSSSASSASSASGSGTTAASASGQCPYTFAVITHGDNGSFWSVV